MINKDMTVMMRSLKNHLYRLVKIDMDGLKDSSVLPNGANK